MTALTRNQCATGVDRAACGPTDGVLATGATTLGSTLNLGFRIGTAMQP